MIRFKPILPKGEILDARKLKRAKKNALDGAAKGALVDYKVTSQTWSHKPGFTIESPSDNERIVGTDDDIYGYVDDGTPPHVIVAKPGKVLTWIGANYRAKTKPRVIGSGRGGNDNTIVYTKLVQHPGTDARDFSVTIAEKWEEQLAILLQRAIDAEVE
jgi:hypothetical protein